MVTRISTVAFEGVDARRVDVEVQIAGGAKPIMSIVGLADKAVAESKERVWGAFGAIGLSLPPRRMIINLAPADLPKEGAHYDLPIALALMAALEIIPADAIAGYMALGELGLDGAIRPINGALPAAMTAHAEGLGVICPAACGPEAAWAGAEVDVLAPISLFALINHFRGSQVLTPPEPGDLLETDETPDLRDIRGQEHAKRALEIAAAGGHNLLFVGPPGSGKSMLAARLPGLLPPLTSRELLQVSMVQSIAGLLERGRLTRSRPFRAPHHSASMAALVGGGPRANPGEASLAHRGVLFLDELPEFHPQALDSLRQPLETGEITVARARAMCLTRRRFQLIAAMNPCRCGGQAGADGVACRRGPRCAADYQARVSGPLMDRIDLRVEVPAVRASDLALPMAREGTAEAALRVAAARCRQAERLGDVPESTNAEMPETQLDSALNANSAAMALLTQAADKMALTARGYRRVQRVARTIADLEGVGGVKSRHVAEALSFRGAAMSQSAHASDNSRARVNAL